MMTKEDWDSEESTTGMILGMFPGTISGMVLSITLSGFLGLVGIFIGVIIGVLMGVFIDTPAGGVVGVAFSVLGMFMFLNPILCGFYCLVIGSGAYLGAILGAYIHYRRRTG